MYFGYLAKNPALRQNFRGLGDFFSDMAANDLPPDGGVFYLRGGYANISRQLPYVRPGTPDAKAQAIIAGMKGDDDHPGYSDRQISEAMTARVINAIAGNPEIWKRSAIVIAYDESDGFYDHVPPRILSYGPDGLPLARGLRVPLIVVSPFARVHAVSHVEGDHNAVIETIEAILRTAGAREPAGRGAGAYCLPRAAVQRSKWLRSKLSGAARHQLADRGRPTFRLRSQTIAGA